MMNKKQFTESQKECASMLGMSLNEYEEYCKNLKVPTNEKNTSKRKNKTNEILNILGLSEEKLKKRKDL